MTARAILIAWILLVAIAGCQAPGEAVPDAPTGTASPAASPIAPAVAPTPSGAERTFVLPSDAPIAPQIEPEPTGPDPTVGTLPS